MPTVQGTWKLYSHRFKGVPCLDPSADLVITLDDDLWTFRFSAGGGAKTASTRSRTPVAEFDLPDSTNTVKIQGKRLVGPVLDKHSTGGVGDKVSLLLAPIVARMS